WIAQVASDARRQLEGPGFVRATRGSDDLVGEADCTVAILQLAPLGAGICCLLLGCLTSLTSRGAVNQHGRGSTHTPREGRPLRCCDRLAAPTAHSSRPYTWS